MQDNQEDPRQVPIGVDDDQVEVNEPEQAEGGEAEGAPGEGGARPSDWNTRASANKMLGEEDGGSPWKGAVAEGDGREGGQEDEQVDVKDIDIDGFDGAKNADVRGGDMEAGGAPAMEFERHWCFGPACTTIRRSLNVVGAVAALANAALDVIYAYRTRYVLASIFQLTCVFLVLRVLATVAAGQYYYTKLVRNYRPSMGDVAEAKNVADEGEEEEAADEEGKRSKNYQEGVTLGQHLYSALHLLLYTGFFRLLPSRDFPYELAVGYALELFLSMVPMLFCMIFNNAETKGEKTALQSAAMLLKVCSLLALLAELILMIWEVSLNRKQAKLGFSYSKKLSEEQRRREWGRKLSWVAVASMATFIVILLIGVLTTEARVCGPREALSSATCTPCEDLKCQDCTDDPKKCKGPCDEGHLLAGDACARCDGEAKGSAQAPACMKCTAGTTKPACTECSAGHGLNASSKLCKLCVHSAVRRVYSKREDGKACVRPAAKADKDITSADQCAQALKDLGSPGSNCKDQKGHFVWEQGQGCACCDPGQEGAGLRNQENSDLYRFATWPGETEEEVDEVIDSEVAAGFGQVTCQSCDGSDTSKCNVCSEGAHKENCNCDAQGQDCSQCCVPCRENMPHCKKCQDDVGGLKGKCLQCDYQVAEQDQNGQCTKCRTDGGWMPDTTTPGRHCKCSEFVNVFAGRKCQTCDQIIPGCSRCEQTDQIYGDQYKVLIGYDKLVANEKKGKYVVCKQCSQADKKMVQMSITNKNGQTTIACKKCNEIIDGCQSCEKLDGSEKPSCTACGRNHYLVRDGDIKKCKPCTKWGDSCTKCSIEGCDDCGSGYWSFMSSGICVKSWW